MTKGIETSLAELLALRAEAARFNFNARKIAKSRLVNNHASNFRPRGMDYFESRPYVAGDDARNIDWRVTARTGNLYSKIYVEERERPVLLLLDFSPSMYFGTRCVLKSVQAARLAALLTWYARDKGDRVGGLIFTPAGEHVIRPGTGNKAVVHLLNSISEATLLHGQSQGENRLEHALKHTAQVARPGSLIFLISDFYEIQDSLRQPLHHLAAHNDIISFFVSDPIEQALPNKHIPLSNGRLKRILKRQHKKARAQLQAYYQQRVSWVENELGNLGQPVIPISTVDTLSEVISQPATQFEHARRTATA